MNTEEDPIVWRIHLRSGAEEVYKAIASGEGRRLFWAWSTSEVAVHLLTAQTTGQEEQT